MACLLRVGLEFLFKLIFRVDEGHRVTRVPANSKELANGRRSLTLLLPLLTKQLEGRQKFGDRPRVDMCECLGNEAGDITKHEQSLQGG